MTLSLYTHLSDFKMNFSEAFQQTKHLVQFSPDGCYLASCSQCRLVIRDVQTLQIINLHTCLDPVQKLIWSPDSQFVMCGMFKRGIVQVGSVSRRTLIRKILRMEIPYLGRECYLYISKSGHGYTCCTLRVICCHLCTTFGQEVKRSMESTSFS